ncbi:unnamed protein product, partial [Polarella glacialis]
MPSLGYPVPKPKPAPIARPSSDYEWSIQRREYGGDDKERRDEERQRDAEQRKMARESGMKADLGAAAMQWARVTESSTSSARKGGKSGKGEQNRKGDSGGKGLWSSWRSTTAPGNPGRTPPNAVGSRQNGWESRGGNQDQNSSSAWTSHTWKDEAWSNQHWQKDHGTDAARSREKSAWNADEKASHEFDPALTPLKMPQEL